MKSVEDILGAAPAPGHRGKNSGRGKQKVAEKGADYATDDWKHLSSSELGKRIIKVEDDMFKAAKDLDFEKAASLRDLLHSM